MLVSRDVDPRTALAADFELLLQRLFALSESDGLSVLADVDLTWTQVRVTMLLACADENPIHWVAEKLGVSVHVAGRTIDQLVELGIVDRHENPADRRVKLVSLTPRGLELIDRHVTEKRKALRTFVDRLPDDSVAALAAAIGPIVASDYLEPQPATAS